MEALDNILSGTKTAPDAAKEPEAAAPAETQEQPSEQQPSGEQKTVPHEALHAEKQKVKRYTEQIASFEKQLKDRDDAWDRRFTQMLERLAPQQQQPAIDWFSDPDGALKQNLDRALNPLDAKFSSLETQVMRLSAVQQHGADKISAFEKYVGDALDRGDPEMAVLSAQMRAARDPMSVGLQWFERRTFDPSTERERLKAEVLAELQGNPGVHRMNAGQPSAPVMPSNLATARNVGVRSGPAWSGPTPLGEILGQKSIFK